MKALRLKLFLVFLFSLLFAGSLHVFSQDWPQLVKKAAPDRAANVQFGTVMSISGDYAIIGASHEARDTNGLNPLTDAGAAYVLYRNKGGADKWGVAKKLVASDRAASDLFGYSVSISGDVAVIGAYNKGGTGSAYIFSRNKGGADNWGQVKKIVSSDLAATDRFGISVSISGDVIVAGADQEDENASGTGTVTDAGSAYIFYRNQGGADNWGQVKKIVSSDRSTTDMFGFRVAVSGDNIIVGDPWEDHDTNGFNGMNNSGSVYFFYRDQGGSDNWGQVKKVTPPFRTTDDRFGASIGISNDTAIVGCFWDDEDQNELNGLTNAGSAYIYYRNQGGTNKWGLVKKIVASDRAANDIFGASVSISGDYAVVSAYAESEDVSGGNTLVSAGSAYIFYRNEGGADKWGQARKIAASDRAANDRFGFNVGISNNYAISGAYYQSFDEAGSNFLLNAGAVYVYRKCPAAVPSANDVSSCTGKTATITATGGTNYRWYTSSTGGSILDSDSSFTTPVLNTVATYTYYLANYNGTCESIRKAINVMVGNSITAKISPLINTNYECNSAPEKLFATPAGGIFSGDGVELGYFIPAQAKVSHINSIYYTYGDTASICYGKDSVTVYVFPCIGLDANSENEIKIYPNPTATAITIENIKVIDVVMIQLFDETGRILKDVRQSDFSKSSVDIDLSAYPAGIYFVKVGMRDNVVLRKVVKR